MNATVNFGQIVKKAIPITVSHLSLNELLSDLSRKEIIWMNSLTYWSKIENILSCKGWSRQHEHRRCYNISAGLPTMPYLSRLTSLLFIPTSLTVKVLRLAAFSFANATISTSPRKLFVTSYRSSSTWTISLLTYKNTVLLWAPKWLLHLPTSFLPNRTWRAH